MHLQPTEDLRLIAIMNIAARHAAYFNAAAAAAAAAVAAIR